MGKQGGKEGEGEGEEEGGRGRVFQSEFKVKIIGDTCLTSTH